MASFRQEELQVRRMKPSECDIIGKWFKDLTVEWEAIPIVASMNSQHNILLLGEFGGRKVASASVTEVAAGIHYISSIFVEEDLRRRRFGSRILDAALQFIRGTAVLDSLLDVTQLYVRRGFKESGGVLTMSGELCLPQREPRGVFPFNEQDFEELLAFDDRCFVCPGSTWRHTFLGILFKKPGVKVMVSRDEKGNVSGYGCCIPTNRDREHNITPLYAATREIAEELLLALGNTVPANEKVAVIVWDSNQAAIELFTKYGVKQIYSLTRMYLGADPKGCKHEAYSLTSTFACGF